jgi:hypothetical protein
MLLFHSAWNSREEEDGMMMMMMMSWAIPFPYYYSMMLS